MNTTVHTPDGKLMTPTMMANWANEVYQAANDTQYKPFAPEDYTSEGHRLNHAICQCGCHEWAEGTPSRGLFLMFSKDEQFIKDYGTAYMQCVICGDIAHL